VVGQAASGGLRDIVDIDISLSIPVWSRCGRPGC